MKNNTSLYLDYSNATGNPTDEEWDKIYALTYNGVMLLQKSDDVPVPWDAGIEVKDNNLIIFGGMGPGGYGNCTCGIKKKDVKEFYHIYVEPLTPDSIEGIQPILDIFEKYGIKQISDTDE